MAGRPSGTSATITARAKTNDVTAGFPVPSRMAKTTIPHPTAATATRSAMWAIWRWSGLASGGWAEVMR